MDVLHVMASGERGGGANHLLGLLPELKKLGYACAAAVDRNGPLAQQLSDRQIQCEELALMHSRLDLRAVGQFAALVHRLRPDIVHCHGTRAAFYAALAKPFARHPARYVYTVHGLSLNKPMGAWGRLTFGAAEHLCCAASDYVISVSGADLDELRRKGWLKEQRSTHLPNAVDTERFRSGDRLAARRALGLSSEDAVVGTVSRLAIQKAVGDLIQAMANVPHATLVVVGDGELRESLLAAASPLGDRIRFLGSRPDVERILPALDVFVLSSHWEGEPIALLEAMAAGLPCVATATAGAKEILTDPELGVLTPIADPSALGDEISHLLADAGRRERLGSAARRAVLSRSHAALAERVAKVYRTIASPAHPMR